MMSVSKNQYYCLEPDDPNIFIWRYMSLGKYINILLSESLFLSRIDKFEDQLEGVPNDFTFQLIDNSFDEFPNYIEMRQQFRESLSSFRKTTFVNCWHMAENESEYMWRNYCPNGKGILIRTCYNKMKNSFYDMGVGPVFIFPVVYADSLNEERALLNGIEILRYKRPHYKDEKEFRIMLQYLEYHRELDAENFVINVPERGYKQKVNLRILIDEVIISSQFSLIDKLRIKLLTKLALNKKVQISKIF